MVNVPFVLEGFEPLDRLGGGGFGEVWLARQTNIDRRVAIKVGHAPIDDKTVALRFERECIALGRLSGHPNIVDVYTAGRLADGRPYLVLEYVSGGTLWQRLQSSPIGEAELIKMGRELSAALSVAHASGVLHRDLKPENVLIRQSGEAVLGDFGIARLTDGANTTSHAITASVAYAPPEILSGGAASIASDIYGIGICLLACVIRSVPFVAKTDESIHPIINRVLTDKPPDLRQHGISPALADLIQQLLAKDPAKRPASADEVKQRLERMEAMAAGAAAAQPAAIDAEATRAVGFIPGQAPAATSVSYATAAPPPPGPAAPAQTGGPVPNYYAPPPGPPPPGPAVHQPQPQPYAYQPQPQPQPTYTNLSGPPKGSNRIRLFGAAFGATLLLGGLLLWAGLQASKQDTRTSSSTTAATTPSSATPVSVTSTTAPANPTGPLSLPLQTADLKFDPKSTIEPDDAGPDSEQYCNNTPKTTGLGDWEGNTIKEPIGFPLMFQQVARFDSVKSASAYVDAYMGTIDCDQWTIPASSGGTPITVKPQVLTPAKTYADDTRALKFDGQSGAIKLHGKVYLVRKKTDVYLVSITSLLDADLARLDDWLKTAVDRLGY